ncbi:uncharacterized protein LOC122498801 [Leptopilina heterotoma]|uniref:uncharacterized protein LOC122498801 n=1 Tax=Leptopilina heterotoma TaxID=63436 RepID=UPI001CA7C705|nr:uncharacterized protein LOC122498801 [Leptopilina heterotoma]
MDKHCNIDDTTSALLESFNRLRRPLNLPVIILLRIMEKCVQGSLNISSVRNTTTVKIYHTQKSSKPQQCPWTRKIHNSLHFFRGKPNPIGTHDITEEIDLRQAKLALTNIQTEKLSGYHLYR